MMMMTLLQLHHHYSPQWFSSSHITTATEKRPRGLGISVRRSSSSSASSSSSSSSSSLGISQIWSYGGGGGRVVDYETRRRKGLVNWKGVYKRISQMENNREVGAGSVLNQWEREGHKLTKWDLSRLVRELRNYNRPHQALQVYEWMNNREERYRFSASDAAIQLDLIAKVHGISSAETYFQGLPDSLKDRRVYGALLNGYVRARMIQQAESWIDNMRSKGYTTHSLPFNVMMTLYMNLKQYDKVEMMISEMMERNIQLDIYSYNIWLSSRGSQGSMEKMEQVFEQMKLDTTINPNWTTFSTMATMYIKMGQIEKAEECLRKVESRITGRDRIPYHYLLSVYGNCGNKEEVYRVWNTYKSAFPSIPNMGYHALISSLVRNGDIEGAEKIYEEWLLVKSSYDPRIGNLLMGFYVKVGNVDKAESLFENMIGMGGKPNSHTWEILAEGHIKERRIAEALSCLKEAFAVDGSKSWRPKPIFLSSFLCLCEEEADIKSKEVVLGLCKQSGFLGDEAYASLPGLSNLMDEMSKKKNMPVDNSGYMEENQQSVGSEILLNQL